MSRVLSYAQSNFGPLAANDAHNFARLRALNIYRCNAIYSFIPKNACSTMRLSVAIENGCIESVESFNWIHQNNQTFAANLRELCRADFTFVLLRCPFRRLASAFLDKVVQREPPFWPMTRAKDQAVRHDELSFRDFVGLLAQRPFRKSNEHWRAQTDFLIYKDYDRYYAVEDFPAARASIEDLTGMTVHDARNLTKHGEGQYLVREDGFYGDMPATELLRMQMDGETPSKRSLYDPEIRRAVETIYADDIALYRSALDPRHLLFAV